MLVSAVAGTALSLLAAGCGGGAGSPGVATVASSGPAITTTPEGGAVAYSRCMRSHGVPGFPDPNSSGTFDGNEIKQLHAGKTHVRAADSECSHLLPNGVVPTDPGYTITRADQLAYLKGAACMRRHGIPDFPDPTFQNNRVTFNIPSSIDKNSPRVRSALAICQKLIPAGLPYSGTS
jgi:hypothetical protein